MRKNQKNIYRYIYKVFFLNFLFRNYFQQGFSFDENFLSIYQMKKYFKKVGININLNEADNKNRSTPTIYYSNHPTFLDPLFVTYVEQTFDASFVAFSFNQFVFPFLKDNLIPVATRPKIKGVNPLIYLMLKLIKKIENFDQDEISKINKKVVPLVTKSLSKKKPVLMFPTSVGKYWQDGMGFIVNDFVKNQSEKKLLFKPIFIEGVSAPQLVIHGWKRILGIKTELEIKVVRGKVFDLTELKENNLFLIENSKKRAKAIKKFLEKKYREEFHLD